MSEMLTRILQIVRDAGIADDMIPSSDCSRCRYSILSQIVQEMRSKFLSRVLFLYDFRSRSFSARLPFWKCVSRATRNYLRIGSLLLHGFNDAFAWMASSSYTAMLLIDIHLCRLSNPHLLLLLQVKKTTLILESSKIATFFFITFVLLHFVGVPMERLHGSTSEKSRFDSTTSLPMLASVTHRCIACGLAFVWYRKFGSVRGVSLRMTKLNRTQTQASLDSECVEMVHHGPVSWYRVSSDISCPGVTFCFSSSRSSSGRFLVAETRDHVDFFREHLSDSLFWRLRFRCSRNDSNLSRSTPWALWHDARSCQNHAKALLGCRYENKLRARLNKRRIK